MLLGKTAVPKFDKCGAEEAAPCRLRDVASAGSDRMSDKNTSRSSKPSAVALTVVASSLLSVSCLGPPAESSSVSPLPFAKIPSANDIASLARCKNSAASLDSTSTTGVCKLFPPRCGDDGREASDSWPPPANAAPIFGCSSCAMFSSKPLFTRKSSSTSRAIVGRKDVASTVLVGLALCNLLPCKPAYGGPTSWSDCSAPESPEELLGLICVASSQPGNGLMLSLLCRPMLALDCSKKLAAATAIGAPSKWLVLGLLPLAAEELGSASGPSLGKPKIEEREVLVKDRVRGSIPLSVGSSSPACL
mmetsp:Transcript_54113/g.126436  ORF Transcript_54113/g.126436 Transcript_54113/m.126436 type:complete len:305 (-) Transcript_54113:791-1705(-)